MSDEQFNEWAQDGAAVIRGDRVRTVWFNEEPSQTPQGQKPVQQRADERGDRVREVPCNRASQAETSGLQGMRDGVSTEKIAACKCVQFCMPVGAGTDVGGKTLVPRVANGVRARSDRLKAIGNGQVPLCAATAFELLTA